MANLNLPKNEQVDSTNSSAKEQRRRAFFKGNLKCFMWLTSLKLVPDKEDKSVSGLKNVLQFDNPFKRTPDGSHDGTNGIVKRLIRFFTQFKFIFFVYVTAKWFLFSLIQYRKDRMSTDIHFLMKEFKSEKQTCETQAEWLKNEDHSTKHKSLLQTWHWTYNLGHPLPSLPGASTFWLADLAAYSVAFYFFGIHFVSTNRVRLDSFCCIFDLRGEKSRLERELAKVLKDAYISLLSCHRCFKSKLRPSNLNNHFETIDRYYLGHQSLGNVCRITPKFKAAQENEVNEQFPPAQTELSQLDSIEGWSLNSNVEVMHDILYRIASSEAVQPAHLKIGYRQKCSNFCYHFVLIFWGLALQSGFLILGWLFSEEMKMRVYRRFTSLDCPGLRSSNVLNGQYVLLDELDKEHIESYSKYDGSLGSFLNLICIEMSHYMTPQTFISCAEIGLTFVPIFGMYFLYYFLYINSFLDQYVWLSQVEEQVSGCIHTLKELDRKLYNNPKHQYQVLHKLTQTYVNYELFRRQQTQYQLTASCNAQQFGFIFLYTLGLGYFIGVTVVDTNVSMILIISTYSVFLLNFYLIGGSMRVDKVEKIMRNIYRIMYLATNNSLQLALIVQLWRRQMLTESEIRERFALKFVGIFITYRRLLTINGYLVTLWWALIK